MKKKNKGKGIGLLIFILLFGMAAWITFEYYKKIYQSTTSFKGEEYFYVYSHWEMKDLKEGLLQQNIINDLSSFEWVADKKEFKKPIAGKYLIHEGINNNELVNLLRSGQQETVQLTFNNIRLVEQLAGRVAQQLELDSITLLNQLKNEELARQYGFTASTFILMFLPNTYEFYWSTSTEKFIQRMAREYKTFWTEERQQKARNIGLSQSEVGILASIVKAEQLLHAEERPRIAGLYLNRLKIGMPLQSDPTLIYALNDFSIKRVLNEHKTVESLYNTYKYKGLPPGPIYLPSGSAIDAVLNYEKSDYLYMCAKEDFSGYHHFSKSLRQHNIHAKAYQNALNSRKIMR